MPGRLGDLQVSAHLVELLAAGEELASREVVEVVEMVHL
jgi:hypothetical protein